MKKMICFDMDGTIADLYNVENWLEKLRAEDVSPYVDAKPMWDMQELRNVLLDLIEQGWEIRVITWLSKYSTQEYKTAVRKAKADWLTSHNFPADKCHMVQYGTTKADTVRKYADMAILVDDNEQVCNGWSLGETINPTTTNVIDELKKLLDK
jgi:hypothetical protein